MRKFHNIALFSAIINVVVLLFGMVALNATLVVIGFVALFITIPAALLSSDIFQDPFGRYGGGLPF